MPFINFSENDRFDGKMVEVVGRSEEREEVGRADVMSPMGEGED